MDRRILSAVDRAEALCLSLESRLFPSQSRSAAEPVRFPPGPPRRPGKVLGSIGYYMRFASDPIRYVGERFETYGDFYYAPGPDGHLYGIRHPDHLQEVLVTRAAQFDKTHSAFKQLSGLLGDGLLTSDGERWRRRRRMIQPAFSQARLAGYAGAMSDEAVTAAARLVDGEMLDVDRAMMEVTLRVVSRALFSHDAGGATTETVSHAMSSFQAGANSIDFALPWMPSQKRETRPARDRRARSHGLRPHRRPPRVDPRQRGTARSARSPPHARHRHRRGGRPRRLEPRRKCATSS